MSKQQVALKIKANANNQASASFRKGEKQERLYYFDWLRVLAVLVVFFAHMAWLFDVLYSWKIENNKAYALIVFGTQSGMALFFLIAGANAWFSLRSRTSRQFLCERRGGILILSLPLIVIQTTLRASFPGYQGWTDFLVWFVFFVYGYLFLADRRFDQAVQKNGILAFLVGITSFLIIVATMYGPAFMNIWQDRPSYSVTYALYQLLFSITAWSLMIFVFYFAKRFLNFDNTFIRYANEALLPFFLLHYLMIVLITYFFVQWDMNMVARFLLVSTLALAATLVVYELLMQRISIARW